MARITITLEDVSAAGSVSFLSEFAGEEDMSQEATPAMLMAMSTRAMFENGMMAEAMNVGLQAIAEGLVPSACILDHFNKKNKDTQ
jgi:hypothetical protein